MKIYTPKFIVFSQVGGDFMKEYDDNTACSSSKWVKHSDYIESVKRIDKLIEDYESDLNNGIYRKVTESVISDLKALKNVMEGYGDGEENEC